jgi:Domain of unknown function (DUF4267)
MSKRIGIGNGLAALIAVGITFVGFRFFFDPAGAASGFGIPSWPHGKTAGYFDIKGSRDIATGLVVLTLLALRHRRALGWMLLVYVIIPASDAVTVLTHEGTVATALGIHGATAVGVLVAAVLLLAARGSGDSLGRGSELTRPGESSTPSPAASSRA